MSRTQKGKRIATPHRLRTSSPINHPVYPNTSVPAATSSHFARRWEDLSHDLLISILLRLHSVELIAGSFSSVCSSWRAAARNPSFWRVLDLSDWDSITRRIGSPVAFHRVLARVLAFTRGGKFIEEVRLSPTSNGKDLIVVSERLPTLLYFSLPNPKMIPEDFCMALSNFKSLRGISVNQSLLRSFGVLFHLNELCLNLAELKLCPGKAEICGIDAVTISHFLPNLKKLEIPMSVISAKAISILLDSLKILEYLTISVHEESVITAQITEKASRLKAFVWHLGS